MAERIRDLEIKPSHLSMSAYGHEAHQLGLIAVIRKILEKIVPHRAWPYLLVHGLPPAAALVWRGFSAAPSRTLSPIRAHRSV
jgi:hypothetical protein